MVNRKKILAEILIVSSFEYQIRFNMIFFNFFSRLILNYEARTLLKLGVSRCRSDTDATPTIVITPTLTRH